MQLQSYEYKQEAPQAFKALMTEVTNLFSDLLYETLSWMQHLGKKKEKKIITSKPKPKHKTNMQANPQRPYV